VYNFLNLFYYIYYNPTTYYNFIFVICFHKFNYIYIYTHTHINTIYTHTYKVLYVNIYSLKYVLNIYIIQQIFCNKIVIKKYKLYNHI